MNKISYDSHPYDVRLELDKMVREGEIKKYVRETCPERGVVFYVETQQGFDPYPFWQQWSDVDCFMHDAQ